MVLIEFQGYISKKMIRDSYPSTGVKISSSNMNFTDEQLRIINHQDGHARVSAVAGSGKTTTMVARLGHLLEQGTSSGDILVLMFNKSARDSFDVAMRARLGGLGKPLPEVRTFHSLGLRLINSFTKRGALAKYRLVTEDFVVERLARQVANEVYQQFNEEEGYLSNDDVEEFITFIDRVKSTTSDAAKVFQQLDLPPRLRFFAQAFSLFEEKRKGQRIRFYGDLIYEPLMAMLDNDELATWVGNRIDHIIVDEYQDINETQQQLLKILASSRANVMVVGDVDQCIYEWRGAKPEYITSRFAKDFKNSINYQLSYTFRYGHQLSLAANHLISNNKKRDRKLCVSHRSNGISSISCVEQLTKHPIVPVLQGWMGQGRALSEAVVLVRLYAQSVPVELALLEAGIPYRLEGGADVFNCTEILALIGYLKLVQGTLGDEPIETREQVVSAMCSQPHLGVKRDEIEALSQLIAADPGGAPGILMQWSTRDFAPFIKKRFAAAAENWQWLIHSDSSEAAGPFLKRLVARFKLYDFFFSFSARAATAENRVKTCEAFIEFATGHKLSVVGLIEKIEEFRGEKESDGGQRLLLTSVHRAKGLEWPFVILPGLEEGSFPFYRDRENGEEIEDERRLFYVAITRAIEKLVCIHPLDAQFKRSLSSNNSRVPLQNIRASRFLYEANLGLSVQLGELLANDSYTGDELKADDVVTATQYLKALDRKVQLVEVKKKKTDPVVVDDKNGTSFLTIDEINEGMAVFHPSFGSGIVSAIKDKKQGRLTVCFEEHGEMILLAAYAKLEAN